MQKKAAEHNKQIARMAAADAKERGHTEEYRHRQRVAALIGRQRALIGGSGFTVDEGSTLTIVEDAATLGEIDALTIRNNASREAWGYEQQATQFQFEAHMARIQQTWGTGATILGGAAATYGTYSSFKPAKTAAKTAPTQPLIR